MYQYSDDDGEGYYGALGSSCGGGYDELGYESNGFMSNFEGNIDGELLKEIIHQLSNDPSYQHLKEYLTEGGFRVLIF